MAKNTFINQAEISHYLKDVRKRKILTPAREKELANQLGQVKAELNAAMDGLGSARREVAELKEKLLSQE